MIEYEKQNDEELLRLIKSGDKTAEECLVSRYMRVVRMCSRPLFLAGGDRKDLIQEGMFGLISAIRQYDPSLGSSFQSFAEHCIHKRLLSAVRSASRLKHFPLNDGMSFEQLSEDPSSPLLTALDTQRSPEDLVLARESKEELYSVFAQCLSRMEKKVLGLYLQGSSYREIAQLLGKDEKAVDNAVQRIRRKLARNPNLGDISIH